jgi:imidazolonepropionase-like amidohydrolase
MGSGRSALAALLGAALAFPALHAQAQSAAIINAHILTMGPAGEIEHGTIVIRDGRIEAVGPDLVPPAGTKVIDAHGQIATPGFILLGSAASAVEFPTDAAYDDSQTKSDFTAAFDMRYALNPNSTYLPEVRRAGSTLALVTPGFARGHHQPYAYFGGQAALISLAASGDILVKPGAAEVLAMGAQGAELAGGSRAAQILQLRSLLAQLQSGADAKVPGVGAEDLEALREIAGGRMPLIVSVHRQSDILQALDLARDFKLRIILDGAEEGWRVADRIAAAKVPVLLDADTPGPMNTETWGAGYENAGKLAAAGVPVAIRLGPGEAVFRHASSRMIAGIAVAHGMDRRKALQSLTRVPAAMLGVDDRFGSLEPGKQADIVLWTGDPLEPASHPGAVLIGGVEQPLASRATLLRDRYLAKDATAAD